MTSGHLLWLVLGGLAGCAHAVWLRHAAGRWRAQPWPTLVRWPLVAAVLIGSAYVGQLGWSSGGWIAAFFATSVWLVVRGAR